MKTHLEDQLNALVKQHERNDSLDRISKDGSIIFLRTQSSSIVDMTIFAFVGILLLPTLVLIFADGLITILVAVAYLLIMTFKFIRSLSYENDISIAFDIEEISINNQNKLLKSWRRSRDIRFSEIAKIKTTHTYYYRFFGQLVTRINLHLTSGQRINLIEYSSYTFGEKVYNILVDLILSAKRK